MQQIINSIKMNKNRMDIIPMNSGNSKGYDPHSLLLNLQYKINLKRSSKCAHYQTLAHTADEKI